MFGDPRSTVASASTRRPLTAADLPVICLETRHMEALLKAEEINEMDRNDARGNARMMPSYYPPTISPATRTLTLSAFPGR